MQGNLSTIVSPEKVVWNQQEISPYGPLRTLPLKPDLFTLAQAHAWKSRRVDETDFIWLGARHYNPQNGRFLSPDPISHPACLDLYAYTNGDPINNMDLDGRFASAAYEAIRTTVITGWNSPYMQGSLQTFGGLGEAFLGSALVTGGGSAPLGIFMTAHGMDHCFAGLQTIFYGYQVDTGTSQLLQSAGMSRDTANFVDNGISICSTMSGATLCHTRITTFPKYNPGVSNSISGESYNCAVFERYKVRLRTDMEKPYVCDPLLNQIVDKMYKPYAQIGSGSTAAAIRHELITGKQVFGRFHSQKGKEFIINLERWLKNNPTANLGDRAAAENIVKDLYNALGE